MTIIRVGVIVSLRKRSVIPISKADDSVYRDSTYPQDPQILQTRSKDSSHKPFVSELFDTEQFVGQISFPKLRSDQGGKTITTLEQIESSVAMDLPSQYESREIFPLLLQLTRCVRQSVAEKYASIEMNETRAGILFVLGHQSVNVSQKDLAEQLCLSESNICGLVERMRKEGLIVRCRSMIDRRRSVLRLTEAGSAMLGKVLDLHHDIEANLIKQLSEPSLNEAVRLIKCLTEFVTYSSDLNNRRVA